MLSISELKKKSQQCRKELIEMAYLSKGVVHLGGSLSAMDMSVAILTKYIPDYTQKQRARFVLSKGHVVAMLYSIFLHDGIVPVEEKHTLKQINSRLQGHPDINKIPETEMNTGLLGQGLGVAMGMAYAKKLKNDPNRVFALCGDAELHEGQIWETIQQSGHFKLDNLVAIIDYNKLSSHDPVNDVINLEPLDKRLESFNWHVIVVKDGNNMEFVVDALAQLDKLQGKPIAIVMHTTKGKGVSFLENNPNSHSVVLSEEQYTQALKEIEGE